MLALKFRKNSFIGFSNIWKWISVHWFHAFIVLFPKYPKLWWGWRISKRYLLLNKLQITNDSSSQFNILRSTLAYHQGLCENGVQDYGLEDFLMDIQLAICEKVIQLLATAKDSTPQKYQALLTKFFGEEKADDFLKIFERGCIVQPVLILTSLYVKNKDNFLLVK